MFGKITSLSVTALYGASPTTTDMQNLAERVLNAENQEDYLHSFIVDWNGASVTQPLLEALAGAMHQQAGTIDPAIVPSASIRFSGLPEWAITWLVEHTNPASAV